MNNQHLPIIDIILADDDKDDCLLFKDALEELPLTAKLTFVHDGEQLIHQLMRKVNQVPSVLFLDLNMPRKNGFECLEEIKSNERLKSLPVIIFSTSYNEDIADNLRKAGADYYICKPPDFTDLKNIIHLALTFIVHGNQLKPAKEKFLLDRNKLANF